MKKTICWILLICVFFGLLTTLTGCSENEDVVSETETNVEESNSIETNKDIVGTWILNRNVRVSNEKYNSLKALFGDQLGNDKLIINEDGTAKLDIAIAFGLTGKYKYENEKLTFYDIQDRHVYNEPSLKEEEEKLELEYVEYDGHEFFKMYLYDWTDFEAYIFFEKEPDQIVSSWADDKVPEITFSNNEKSDATTSKQTDVEVKYTESGIQVGEYTIQYGDYIGQYVTNQTGDVKDNYTATIHIKIKENQVLLDWNDVEQMWVEDKFSIKGYDIIGESTHSVISVIDNNTLRFLDISILKYQN